MVAAARLCDGARAEMEGGGGRPEEGDEQERFGRKKATALYSWPRVPGKKTNRCLRRGLRYRVSAQPVPKGPTSGKWKDPMVPGGYPKPVP